MEPETTQSDLRLTSSRQVASPAPDGPDFRRFRVVLCRPQVSGNVGAVCRSMLNFGPSRLYLVSPECDHLDEEARKRALVARGILQQARVVDQLAEALAGCSRVVGSTARSRAVNRAPTRPRQAIECALDRAGPAGEVALVFGQERSGLSNEELDLCHDVMTIPTGDELSSLNLGTAASIALYELRLALLERTGPSPPVTPPEDEGEDNGPATTDSLEGMYGQMFSALREGEFLNPENPDITMRYLRRFFAHSGVTEWEVRLWRAIWRRIYNRLKHPRESPAERSDGS